MLNMCMCRELNLDGAYNLQDPRYPSHSNKHLCLVLLSRRIIWELYSGGQHHLVRVCHSLKLEWVHTSLAGVSGCNHFPPSFPLMNLLSSFRLRLQLIVSVRESWCYLRFLSNRWVDADRRCRPRVCLPRFDVIGKTQSPVIKLIRRQNMETLVPVWSEANRS